MSKLSLNEEMNIEVRVLLIAKGTDDPVTGMNILYACLIKIFLMMIFLERVHLMKMGLQSSSLQKSILQALRILMKNLIFILWFTATKKKFLKAG